MRSCLSIFVACLLAAGCAEPPSDARVTETVLPDRGTFPYVGEVLEVHCGTLDCHGSVFRNLRIYGDEGLRYSPADHPCVPSDTTEGEFGQDYDSVVGLQPEVLNEVMADHGADPERLDLLAKPMGIDAHKGLTIITKGDDKYTCITSWLAGDTNKPACLSAMLSTPAATICGKAPATLFVGTP
jgi:hypothetical protein